MTILKTAAFLFRGILLALGIGVVLVLVVPFFFGEPDPAREAARQAEDARSREIAQRVVAQLAQQLGWETVKVNEASRYTYRFEIVYRAAPRYYEAVEADTKMVIRALLGELKNAAPAELSGVMISCNTRRNVTGETGKPLVQDFGWAHYSYLRDTIEFNRP